MFKETPVLANGLKICGIDPGIHGAIACIAPPYDRIRVEDMPVNKHRRIASRSDIDAQGVADILRMFKPDVLLIERVASRPGQGVASMFKFGRGVGVLEGVAAGMLLVPNWVTPQSWRKKCSVPPGKDGSRERAMALFPKESGLFDRKKDDGRAEAALIALSAISEKWVK